MNGVANGSSLNEEHVLGSIDQALVVPPQRDRACAYHALYICIYEGIYDIYIYVYTHTYIYIYIHVWVCVLIDGDRQRQVCMHMPVGRYVDRCTCMCVCVYIYMYIQTYLSNASV